VDTTPGISYTRSGGFDVRATRIGAESGDESTVVSVGKTPDGWTPGAAERILRIVCVFGAVPGPGSAGMRA